MKKPRLKIDTLIPQTKPVSKKRMEIVLHVDVPDDDTFIRSNFNKEVVKMAADLTHRWKGCEAVLLTTEEIER